MEIDRRDTAAVSTVRTPREGPLMTCTSLVDVKYLAPPGTDHRRDHKWGRRRLEEKHVSVALHSHHATDMEGVHFIVIGAIGET